MSIQDEAEKPLKDRVQALQQELGRERRLRRFGLVLGVVALATVPVGAGALGPVPNVFTAREPIFAAEMNENFAYLQDGVTAVEERQAARFCGVSIGSTDGDAGGYAGISALCGSASGCGASARICLNTEVVLSLAEGIAVPSGGPAWIATGDTNGASNECSAFTSAEATRSASTWTATPGLRSCDTSLPVLCCE